jgi:hypothetical protein
MRTQSTESMKEKNPVEKWQSLFSMYKEWSHHDRVARGQVAAKVLENQPKTQKEMNEIRAAILSLQKRKNLGAADRALLEDLQAKLRAYQKASKKHGEAVIVA